jgi:fibronectin-binding autotransporter adhesin
VTGNSTLGTLTASSLAVTGAATIGGTLGVTGNTTLGGAAATSLTVTGATTLGALTAGAATLASLSTTGAATLGGNLTVPFLAVRQNLNQLTALNVENSSTGAQAGAILSLQEQANSPRSVILQYRGPGAAVFGDVPAGASGLLQVGTGLSQFSFLSNGPITFNAANGTERARIAVDRFQSQFGTPMERFTAGSAAGSSLNSGTTYIGFNALRSGLWTANSDGTNNGGSVIWGNIFGGLSFGNVPALPAPAGAASQSVSDATLLANLRLYIDPAGNIGVGTGSPTSKLHVSGGDVRWSNSLLGSDQGGNLDLGGTGTIAGIGKPYIDFHFGPRAPEDYNVRISNDAHRQLTIDADNLVVTGNLVATLAPAALNVTGAVTAGSLRATAGAITPLGGWSANAGIQFQNILAGNDAFVRVQTPSATELRATLGVSGTAADDRVTLSQGGSDRLVVWQGRVGIGTLVPAAGFLLDVNGVCHASDHPVSSDERLKKNVRPLESALERVRQLNGVSFQWKRSAVEAAGKAYHEYEGDKSATYIGFLAQDVEETFPELVSHWEGKDGEDYRALSYARMTAVLVEAIKELAERLDRQEAPLGETR